MSGKNLEKIRHDILMSTQDKLKENFFSVSLSDKAEHGAEVLLVALGDSSEEDYEALGNFFFLPGGEDDELLNFVSLLTISEELHEETIQELCIAVSAINAYMPSEGFAIDFASRSLEFKHTYVLPADLEEADLQEGVELSIAAAIGTVSRYAYLLTEVNEGERTAESVIGLFTDL